MKIVAYGNRKRAHNWLPNAAGQLADTDPERALKCLQLYSKWEYHYSIREQENQLKAIRGTKLYRLGEKIKWFGRKLKGGLRCVQEHGWRYTFYHGLEKVQSIFAQKKDSFTQKNLVKIWITFLKKVMAGYRLYKNVIQKYGENAYLLLSGASTGDPYIHSMFFKAYTEKCYPNLTPIFGTFGAAGLEIANLFGIEYAESYSSDEFRVLWNLLLFDLHDNIRMKSMHYHVIYRHTSILMHLEGLHGFNLFSLSQAFLGIESDDDIRKPAFDDDKKLFQNIFEENNLIPGKTVLLVPYAKSVKLIPMSFWIRLANELIAIGFTVCTNSVGEKEPPIEHTAAVCVPYSKTVPFLEAAGATVGLRCGFQDVTCTAKCPKITLYPKRNYKRSIVCDINVSYSVSGMYNQPEQYDFIYSAEKEDELISTIVGQLLNTLGESKNIRGS